MQLEKQMMVEGRPALRLIRMRMTSFHQLISESIKQSIYQASFSFTSIKVLP
jgi:hypothetical protein